MIAAEVTQGVFITLIVVPAVLIVAWLVSRKANEPSVMRAKAEITEERLNATAIRNHKERMAQVEYDRAQQNLERDRQRNELELRQLNRELEAGKPDDSQVRDQ